MRVNNIKLLVTSLALMCSTASSAVTSIPLTVEEQRLSKITALKSHVVDKHMSEPLHKAWLSVTTFEQAKSLLESQGESLWHKVKQDVQSNANYDDRPLYWQRLAVKALLKKSPLSFSNSELSQLLEVYENASRGYGDVYFKSGTHKQIFVTGFDPFLLDKNIEQSNPSGLAALALDGKVIEYQGQTAEINAVIVPVRYEDFDQGEIESILAPVYLAGNVDMVATISMGREHFDLERFPGKRRSVTAPDNVNKYSGGDKKSPVISMLAGNTLSGDEFVEFSLPVKAMQTAKGPYLVIDNHKVESLEKGEQEPKSLSELNGLTAVMGGGGGYLSNEISYRSIRLKNQLGIEVPTGHIHTPRIKGFDNQVNKGIVNQIEAMLKASVPVI